MSRTTVDCSESDWSEKVHATLYRGDEVDLINFTYEAHGSECEQLAHAFNVDFTLDRNPSARAAQLRLKPAK